MTKRLRLVPKPEGGRREKDSSANLSPSSPSPAVAPRPVITVEIGPFPKSALRQIRLFFRFSIDRVTLHSPTHLEHLRWHLPQSLIAIAPEDNSPYAHSVKLQRANLYQYQAQLQIIAPTLAYWEQWQKYVAWLGAYKISYLELAFDHSCPSLEDAYALAASLTPYLRKKYHKRLKVKEVEEYPLYTVYVEDRRSKFNLTLYSRPDKRTQEPVVRVEWRLREAGRIAKKIGVRTLEDFEAFDPSAFFQRFFALEKVNAEEFGRWLMGVSRSVPVVKYFRVRDRHIRHNLAERTAAVYLHSHEIERAADLRGHLLEEKRKAHRKSGALTSYESRVKWLTSYRRNRFFTPLDMKVK